MRLFEVVKLYMRVNGITIKQLADAIEVPATTVSRMLQGRNVSAGSAWALLTWLLEDADMDSHAGEEGDAGTDA